MDKQKILNLAQAAKNAAETLRLYQNSDDWDSDSDAQALNALDNALAELKQDSEIGALVRLTLGP